MHQRSHRTDRLGAYTFNSLGFVSSAAYPTATSPVYLEDVANMLLVKFEPASPTTTADLPVVMSPSALSGPHAYDASANILYIAHDWSIRKITLSNNAHIDYPIAPDAPTVLSGIALHSGRRALYGCDRDGHQLIYMPVDAIDALSSQVAAPLFSFFNPSHIVIDEPRDILYWEATATGSPPYLLHGARVHDTGSTFAEMWLIGPVGRRSRNASAIDGSWPATTRSVPSRIRRGLRARPYGVRMGTQTAGRLHSRSNRTSRASTPTQQPTSGIEPGTQRNLGRRTRAAAERTVLLRFRHAHRGQLRFLPGTRYRPGRRHAPA